MTVHAQLNYARLPSAPKKAKSPGTGQSKVMVWETLRGRNFAMSCFTVAIRSIRTRLLGLRSPRTQILIQTTKNGGANTLTGPTPTRPSSNSVAAHRNSGSVSTRAASPAKNVDYPPLPAAAFTIMVWGGACEDLRVQAPTACSFGETDEQREHAQQELDSINEMWQRLPRTTSQRLNDQIHGNIKSEKISTLKLSVKIKSFLKIQNRGGKGELCNVKASKFLD